MVLKLDLEEMVSTAPSSALQDLGIKSVYNSRTKQNYWHRIFDSLEMEVEGQWEKVAGRSTFVNGEAVNFALEKYDQYQTALQQEGGDKTIEALEIAREYLGKRPLVQRAEIKLRTYCLDLIQQGDQDSIIKAKDLIQRGKLRDYSLIEQLKEAEECRSNLQLESTRNTYLQNLSKSLEDTNLTAKIDQALRSSQVKINNSGDGAYFTLVKMRNAYSARQALEWAIQKSFSANLIDLAYTSWRKWQTVENEYNRLKKEKTPQAYLQALDYAVSQGLDENVYYPLYRQKGKLEQIQAGLQRGQRERKGDIVYDTLLGARIVGIELNELSIAQEFIADYSAKRWEPVQKTWNSVKEKMGRWWKVITKTKENHPNLILAKNPI
ncbi:MAG TPA: hypothetical protein VJA23_05540 [Candidatus Nanoarchaeia archaeon]|nr:hypothetical protein [Candidatus Nanoarchaeia archaeon]